MKGRLVSSRDVKSTLHSEQPDREVHIQSVGDSQEVLLRLDHLLPPVLLEAKHHHIGSKSAKTLQLNGSSHSLCEAAVSRHCMEGFHLDRGIRI